MKKKWISWLLSSAMAVNILALMPINSFAASGDSRVYEKEGYTVTYSVGSEWDNSQTIEVKIENTGEESILNWALKYDIDGTLSNVWNSTVYSSNEEYTVIKNSGYNYEIAPGQSVNYGYILTSETEEPAELPEDIEMYSRRIDVKSGYDVDFNVTSDWYTGFQAEIAITNTSAEPIEAWTLGFDSNFDINNIWNAKLLSSEEQSYVTANQLWTTPINPGASASFGFTADKSATENAWAENFTLTAVVVGESSLEKEPEIDYELDTDSDGLPDYYEEIIGSDPNAEHSDDDQLPDGYEALYLGTDPSKSDSDDNGISDADEDFDTDGLTNLEEYNLGTDPFLEDSDYDTLSDKDEVNIHGTNPTKGDTDDDLVPDGDEVKLGLDPNSGSTNGTPDSERTFSQVVTAESEVLAAVNDDAETPFDVSLEITAAGVAESNVYARESGYSNAIENPSIIGIAPEFVYTDGLEVEEVTVKFELDDSIVDNTLGTYVSSSTEFEGIKRLNVFMFFEDVNMLLPVETFHDEATNTVYTTTDRMGTYCLVDMELFFDNLDIAPSDDEIEEDYDIETQEFLDEPVFSSYNISELKINTGYTDKKDNFDVVFLIDVRNLISAETYSELQRNIIETADAVFTESPNARVKIIEMLSVKDYYGSEGSKKVVTRGDIGDTVNADSDYFYNLDEVYSALEYVTYSDLSKHDSSNCNISDAVEYVYNSYNEESHETYVFCIVQTKFSLFKRGSKNAYDILNDICDNKLPINISTFFSNEHTSKYGYAIDIFAKTGGITNYTYNSISPLMLEHIYGYTPTVENGYKTITATGYQTIQLTSSLQQNYEWYRSNALNVDDTDYDGLYDYQEIMFTAQEDYPWSLINTDDPGNVSLYTFQEIKDILYDINGDKLFYVEQGLERYRSVAADNYTKQVESLMDIRVLPIASDPTKIDSDEDDISDCEEYFFIKTSPISSDTDGDGLDDGIECANWYDPLNPNPDDDVYWDKEEYENGTNPYGVDFTPANWAYEFIKGVVQGDAIKDPSIPALFGQIAGGIAPGVGTVADVRDAIVNASRGEWFMFGMSALGIAPVWGDIAKSSTNITQFISKNIDNADELAELILTLAKMYPDDWQKFIPEDQMDEIVTSLRKSKGKLSKKYYDELDIIVKKLVKDITPDELIKYANDNCYKILSETQISDIITFVKGDGALAKKIVSAIQEVAEEDVELSLAQLVKKYNIPNVPNTGSLSAYQTRIWYRWQETLIEENISAMRNNGKLPEEIAKYASAARNTVRTGARELMNDEYISTYLQYYEKNMSWADVVEKYKNQEYKNDALWEKIIEVSTSSRNTVNQFFGLEGKC